MTEMKTRKSWREKINGKTPEIVDVQPGGRFPAGKMLIPAPADVEKAIAAVPKGQLLRLSELRARLAAHAGADYSCPLTTGIFVRIVAEAAAEERSAVPYWRVVKDDGSLNPKFPGGEEAQAANLRAEGHAVVPGTGKKPARVAVD